MKINGKRVVMSLCGVLICAVAVGIFKTAAFGVDPFQSLMSGLEQLIPIPFGTLYVIVNAVLLIFSIAANRRAIGIATFINLFLLGYITQFSYAFLQTVFPAPSVLVRSALLAAAIVVMCFGSSLYMTAELGVSTYDAVAITMAEKWHWGQFRFIRITTDLVCVALGIVCFLAGGGTWQKVPTVAGIATVITAFFMGPLIQFFNEKVARPFLEK